MRILVVEDDPALGPSLCERLASQSYAVDLATNGAQAREAALLAPYDLIILDILLPGMDGLMLCRELRARGCASPILLLTALGEVERRIAGLDAGADDYLCKPFAFGELEARVRALLRRGAPDRSPVLRCADLALDTRTREVARGGVAIALTSKEYALLEYFMRNAGQVLTRTQLAEHVWDFAADHLSNVIEVFIANLRRKLGEPDLILTVRGAGYRLREME